MRSRISALLIVLALGTAPISTAICEYMCLVPVPAPTCHDSVASLSDPQLGGAAGACDHARTSAGFAAAGRPSASSGDAGGRESAGPRRAMSLVGPVVAYARLHGPPGAAVSLSVLSVSPVILRI